MIVTHLSLTDFRNYREAEVAFEPGPNLVVGSNGQGKTNLVEAIAYLSTLGSHRVAGDQPLIRSGCDAAVIRARLRHDDREVLVEAQLNRGAANRAQVNRAAIKPRELPRYAATVVFAPEDLAIVRGDPAGRRRLLDELLVQTTPRLAGVLADYERVVRQRSTLLKSARAARVAEDGLSTLDVWDDRLVELGTEIIVARLGLVDRLRPQVAAAYREVAGPEHAVDLAMRLSILGADDEDATATDATTDSADAAQVRERFRAALASVRRAELDRGLSLVGPHRDDLLLTLNTLPARGYASHGESWSFALSLKLASAAVLRAESTLGDPVLILDDVFAELDEGRRSRLASAIAGYEQVLITAAVFDDVPDPLRGRVTRIRAGEVVDEGGEET